MKAAAEPRHPELVVSLASDNPVALIAAVREALRRAHVDREEIDEFSTSAFTSHDPQRRREVCRRWVKIALER